MQLVKIIGKRRLNGFVPISGSKNASLPLIAASILTSNQMRIENVPDLEDIRAMGQILSQMNCDFSLASGVATIKTENIQHNPNYNLVKQLRASVCLMGALVGRRGNFKMPLPGGCVIGIRSIDLHLRGLQQMGCEVAMENGLVSVRTKQLQGNRIFLGGRFGSTVTGTANILCAATLAKGETEIQCAACEPEIVDLCNMLVKMGAKIEGIGSPILHIQGVDELFGTTHRVIPDRIEFGTFLALALMTRSRLVLPHLPEIHWGALLSQLIQAGAVLNFPNPEMIEVCGDQSKLQTMEITTLPFPGFPTDLQPIIGTLMTQIEGLSLITERIYGNRFGYVGELTRMGAEITLEGATAIIHGRTPLMGAPVTANDLRAGAALYMAGLAAEGETTIYHPHQVDRGYENFELKLRNIGAQVQRTMVEKNSF